MQLRIDQLATALERGLAPLYVVHGEEELLALEAADQIRRAARRAGLDERTVLFAQAKFDWAELAEATRSLSLFGGRTFVDLRIPTGKPGKEGSAALVALTEDLPPDGLVLIILPGLEREQRSSAWFTALAGAGTVIEAHRVDRARLPDWIGQRLAAQRQRATPEALAFLADQVEGNLFAAHQEIQKLGLLYPEGILEREQVETAVLNVARYSFEELRAALLAGDRVRLSKTLAGLAAEGESAVFAQWILADEIRTLVRAQLGLAAGQPLGPLLRELRVFGQARESQLQRALKRLAGRDLKPALRRAAALDRQAKGLRPAGSAPDVWTEFERVGALLA